MLMDVCAHAGPQFMDDMYSDVRGKSVVLFLRYHLLFSLF